MKLTIIYVYRGLIERGTGRGYKWTEGWSAQTPEGHILYPWMTRRECYRDAATHGAKAIFVRI